MPKVLIVEDDEVLARGLEFNLVKEGFEVVRSRRGDRAVELALRVRPDLVTLDVMLPGADGFEVCRELRRRGVDAPIIMLTARNEELDRVLGLEIGADDYVTKPFSVRELIARIKARLRRETRNSEGGRRYAFGSCEIDLQRLCVSRDGAMVDLTAKEVAILALLVRARGDVVTRDRILDEIWGGDAMDARRIDAHVVNLRKKLEDDAGRPKYILSVYGEGYRFAG